MPVYLYPQQDHLDLKPRRLDDCCRSNYSKPVRNRVI